ncbi:DUF4031 domain-containing protein [Leucobacter tenebrionis]|uniref:DUF4031 domain-containing protein n=1 Tax=Leucobacter tenebrionis TaxID=2873270 RepID=UPI001CA62174|nr:DUF4031 domain-containing protein [Leucobacter tenebrionis]QZY51783.1 DUF4031 domain-containing protein [Leucobacter tenebrionis]
MAILIDPPAWPAHGTLWSHLISDSGYDELHAFARRLGVPRRGFDLDHYDVAASLYERAIALGARPVSGKDVVHALLGSGLRVRQAERPVVTPVRRRQFLIAEWAGLGALISADSSRVSAEDWLRLGENLVTRWNEPHRSYHDERHLEDVLLALDHLAVRGERVSPVTLLAAWFHDAVYTGATGAEAGGDEFASAHLATGSLAALGLDPALVRQVGEFIVATTPAREVRDPAPPLAHLLDADLSIFAASPHRYQQYTEAVRLEYAHVPEPDFASGRSRILSAYLDQPAIYRTGTAQQLWEQRARENVGAEIERLRGAAAE